MQPFSSKSEIGVSLLYYFWKSMSIFIGKNIFLHGFKTDDEKLLSSVFFSWSFGVNGPGVCRLLYTKFTKNLNIFRKLVRKKSLLIFFLTT